MSFVVGFWGVGGLGLPSLDSRARAGDRVGVGGGGVWKWIVIMNIVCMKYRSMCIHMMGGCK